MVADVKLDDDVVTLEGMVHITEALRLRSGQESTDSSIDRRAMKHDTSSDSLTINVDGDYPGGVQILGTVRMPGDVQMGTVKMNKSDLGDSTVNSLTGRPGFDRSTRMYLFAENVTISRAHGGGIEGSRHNIALSHSTDDQLIINRGGGYEGGVQIDGAVTINGGLKVILKLEHGPGWGPDLVKPSALDIGEYVWGLKVELEKLKERVAKLETKVHQ